MAQTISDAMAAGFSRAQATVLTAIAAAESALNPNAIGDVALENATWGPSVGETQIRTLRSQTGTGGDRDINRLLGDPTAQMAASWDISSHGTDWSPWSTYKSGAYQKYLPAAQAAASGASAAQAGGGTSAAQAGGGTSTGATTAGFSLLPMPDWKDLILRTTFTLGGLGLVVAGAITLVSPKAKALVAAKAGA